MNLEYRVKNKRDDDGLACDHHILYDTVTGRIWGYVETPKSNEVSFMASPHHSETRFYVNLQSAKDYLEHAAVQGNIEEGEESTQGLYPAPEKPPEKLPEEPSLWKLVKKRLRQLL